MSPDESLEPKRDWVQYFKTEIGQVSPIRYAIEHAGYHLPAFSRVRNLVPEGGSIIDVGCGLGPSLTYFDSYGYRACGIESDAVVGDMARQLLGDLGVKARVEQMDAFALKEIGRSFDLAFSLGVLEHFDPHKFIELLEIQASVARFVLAVIPTKHMHLHAPAVDERIYTSRQLRGFFESAGLQVIDSFGYGDLGGGSNAHRIVQGFLPHGLYRLMQNRGFAMQIGCIGRSRTLHGAVD